VARDAPTRPSGHAASLDSGPTQRPVAPGKASKAPLIILLLVILAAGGGALWFFVLRAQAVDDNKVATPGSDTNKNVGSNKVDKIDNVGSGSDDKVAGNGSGAEKPVAPAAGPMLDIEITANTPKATVEVLETDLKGPVPFKTKLEKGKAYKLSIAAPGFATLVQDIQGGQDKVAAKLIAKPMMIKVTSEPAGALILVDGVPIGHSTPFDVELTKAQAAKKNVRIGLRKIGFRPTEKMVDVATFTEDPAKMMAEVKEKLVLAPVVVPPRPPPAVGSGSAGPGPGSDAGTGSGTPPPTGSGTPTPTPGSAKEPEPGFVNPNP
jgi:hypothetical protein